MRPDIYENCVPCDPVPQPVNQQVAQEMAERGKEAHDRADRLQAEADAWRAVGIACNRALTSLNGDDVPSPEPKGY